MMAANPEKTKIVKEYIEKFKEQTTLSISRKLSKDYPEWWITPEQARSNVRYYRGNYGKKNLKSLADKTLIRPNGKAGFTHKIPTSDYKPWKPYFLKEDKILVLSDIHIPFHDVNALNLALEHADSYKPNAILLNGDIIDFYDLSQFMKNPRQRNLKNEVTKTKQFLNHLIERFNAKIYFKLGNHEDRWDKFFYQHAPEMCDMPFADIGIGIGLNDMGIKIIGDARIVKVGKLPVLHGHEFQRGVFSPVNTARGAFLKGVASCMVSHSHIPSHHPQTNLNGKLIMCWSTGCLCGLNADYARVNKWAHGFATIDVKPGGGYKVNNYSIFNGEIL